MAAVSSVSYQPEVAGGSSQPVNISQVGGTATDTNSGVKSAGTIRVVIATDQPALTNPLLVVTSGNSFTNITTATDTVVKGSAGALYGLIINTGGAGSSAVIYNNTAASGAKIGTFSTATQGSLSNLNVAASTGITVTTSGGTPADITVVWR